MNSFRILLILLILFTSCQKVENKYYEGELNSKKIQLNVKRSVSNTVYDYLELNVIREINQKYDSINLLDENRVKIKILSNKLVVGFHEMKIQNSFELYNENEVLFLIFYKNGIDFKTIKMYRKYHSKIYGFRGH